MGFELEDVKQIYKAIRAIRSGSYGFAGLAGTPDPERFPDSIASLLLPRIILSILRDNGIFTVSELLSTPREELVGMKISTGNKRHLQQGGLDTIEQALANRGERLQTREELSAQQREREERLSGKGTEAFRRLGLPDRVVEVLLQNGITTITVLRGKSPEDLSELPGLGDADSRMIYRALRGNRNGYGFSLAATVSRPKRHPNSIALLGLRLFVVNLLRDNGIFTVPELLATPKEELRRFWSRAERRSGLGKRLSPGDIQSIEEALAQRGEGLHSREELRSALPAGTAVREVPQEGARETLVGMSGQRDAATWVFKELEKAARLRLERENATPSYRAIVTGVGPEQSSRHADALRVIGQLLPESLRGRFFILTRTAPQAVYLASLGIVASDQPYVVVDGLRKRFGEVALRTDYHATEVEQQVLRDAVLLFGLNMEVVARPAQTELQDFLRELLSTLTGMPSQTVPNHFNIQQLTEDIDLLIRA